MIEISGQAGITDDSADVASVRTYLESLAPFFPNNRSCSAVFREGSVSIQIPGAMSGTCSQAFQLTPDANDKIREWLLERFRERRLALQRAAQECCPIIEKLTGSSALSA